MKNEQGTAAEPSNAETVVRNFYNNYGWVSAGTHSGEDINFRKFSGYYYSFYSRSVFRRTLSCFDDLSGKLLIAGCGDMPDDHVTVARRFQDVTCIDISERALSSAAEKMGDSAKYIHDSILHIPLPENAFEAVLCAHVLYHVDAKEQLTAVLELIRVTKPGGRVVVIYSNPNSVFALQFWKTSWLGRLAARIRRTEGPALGAPAATTPTLYFACHSLGWWRQFEPACTVRFLPWDVMGSRQAQVLLRGRMATVLAYRTPAWLERVAPALAVRLWQYTIVILEKKGDLP